MNEVLKERNEILNANENDISRVLKTVDLNQDDRITFDEFVKLLLLFYSNKENLRKRLTRVLKINLNNNKKLNLKEAKEFVDFLNKFFGLEDQEKNENINGKILLDESDFVQREYIDIRKFINKLLPNLQTVAFVRSSREQKQNNNEN
jgi:hypothetical protein